MAGHAGHRQADASRRALESERHRERVVARLGRRKLHAFQYGRQAADERAR